MTVRAVLWFSAAVAMIGCTDPTAVGPPPNYLGVENERGAVLGTTPESRRPSESCPRLRIAPNATQRVPVPGLSLSVAFTADVRVEGSRFAPGLGGVLLVPGTGGIAVTPAPNFPYFYQPAVTGARSVYRVTLPEWCFVTIRGTSAPLNFLSIVTDQTGRGALTELIGNDVVISLRDPNGRLIRFRVFATTRNSTDYSDRDELKIQPLLDAVASLEW